MERLYPSVLSNSDDFVGDARNHQLVGVLLMMTGVSGCILTRTAISSITVMWPPNRP
jgi:hypothetical protein